MGEDGTVRVVDGKEFAPEDPAVLEALVKEAAQGKKDVGIIKKYDLRYFRERGPMGERILFMDVSDEQRTLEHLGITCLLIGVCSFCVFLVLSILLARWAIRPVERAWEEQRQFVADASHELKTPLTVILANAEMLEQSPEERTEQLAGSIRTMSQQMRGLVEGLLDLARVDNGAVKKVFQDFNWSEAVSDAVLPFEPVFFEAGLMLKTEIQEDIRVKGSRQHLLQVMENLLDNAKKYAEPHSQVTLTLKKTGHRECLLQVDNRGEPISPEDLKNIFKRFYRVDKARAMNQSYGLGLSIAQSIVADHGGKIWAQSKDGVNSFFVSLNTLQ